MSHHLVKLAGRPSHDQTLRGDGFGNNAQVGFILASAGAFASDESEATANGIRVALRRATAPLGRRLLSLFRNNAITPD
jgi:hypothetical protein